MRQITVNVNCEKGKLNRYFQRCIGAGRAAEVMRYTAFEQLKQIQKKKLLKNFTKVIGNGMMKVMRMLLADMSVKLMRMIHLIVLLLMKIQQKVKKYNGANLLRRITVRKIICGISAV